MNYFSTIDLYKLLHFPRAQQKYPNKELEENALSLFWQMGWLLGDVHNWSEQFTWRTNLSLIRRERERAGERDTERVWYSGIVSGLLLFSLQIQTAVNDMSISCLSPPQQDTLVTQKNNNPKKVDSLKDPSWGQTNVHQHTMVFSCWFFFFFLPQKPHLDGRRCF